MKTRSHLLKKIAAAAFTFAVSAGISEVSAQPVPPGQFPFFRSFMDGNTDYVTFPAGNPILYGNPKTPGLTGPDRSNAIGETSLTAQGMVLTYTTNQVGAFYLPEHTFSTDDGFLIEFEYIMRGDNTKRTDGMVMFLVDGEQKGKVKFGAEGAGFGYTHRYYNYNASAPSGQKEKTVLGVVGGYLAVALDQGPFKTLRMEGHNDGEMRNGIPYNDSPGWTTGVQLTKYDTLSNVTIRGAAGNGERSYKPTSASPTYATRPPGAWGYPVLITRHTGGDADNQGARHIGFKLDPLSGNFVQQNPGELPPIPDGFNISGGSYFTSPADAAYRKAIIALEPNPAADGGGFKITVTIQHGQTKTTVIENFTYPETVSYIENGYPRDVRESNQVVGTPPIETYTVPTPEKLMIGFMGSTGWNNPYTNIIRNLRITPIYAANTANDDIRDHRRGPVTVRPFDNDLGYKEDQPGVPGSVIGDKDFLDWTTFRFWTDEYTCMDSLYEIPVDEGKWVYDPSMGEVLFFPNRGYTGTVDIGYDIKGKFAPFNQEKYRSSIAVVSVTIADNQPVR